MSNSIKQVFGCINCGKKVIRSLFSDPKKPCPKCGDLMSAFGEKTIFPDK